MNCWKQLITVIYICNHDSDYTGQVCLFNKKNQFKRVNSQTALVKLYVFDSLKKTVQMSNLFMDQNTIVMLYSMSLIL